PGSGSPTRSVRFSPQYRQRFAASRISAPHIGQGRIAPAATDVSSAACPVGSGARGTSTARSPTAVGDGSEPAPLWPGKGTVTVSPHPGQLALTPALSAGVFSSFWQKGQ